jgi:hypothetical protein
MEYFAGGLAGARVWSLTANLRETGLRRILYVATGVFCASGGTTVISTKDADSRQLAWSSVSLSLLKSTYLRPIFAVVIMNERQWLEMSQIASKCPSYSWDMRQRQDISDLAFEDDVALWVGCGRNLLECGKVSGLTNINAELHEEQHPDQYLLGAYDDESY